eukprot:1149864-Pelagomonas_calceolata.AAC.2
MPSNFPARAPLFPMRANQDWEVSTELCRPMLRLLQLYTRLQYVVGPSWIPAGMLKESDFLAGAQACSRGVGKQ